MYSRSRKITYAALTAAIAVCCMILAQLVPFKSPLFVCALCFYIALDKCGIAFGLLSIISSIILILLMGFLGTAVLVALVFAPYGFIAYLMRKLTYNKPWHIAIRVTVSIIFANFVCAVVYFLANLIMPELNLAKLVSFIGGYFFLALFVTLFFIVTDYFFKQFCDMFAKLR